MSNLRIQWKSLSAAALAHDAQLLQSWDKLNAERGSLPFLAADVTISALNILGSGNERLLVGNLDDKVVAMFLLAPSGRFKWQTFQPSQIPLGAWVAEAGLPLQALAHSLMRGPLGFCLVLSVTQIDPLVALRQADATDCQTSDYIETGWIDIQGTFDDYWAARGKNLRQNMRKQRNKLQTEGTKIGMQILTAFDDMAPAVARYGSLESKGWKAEKGTAIHPDNAQGKFYRELLEHASKRGEAVVYQYLFNDRVVAMNLCLLRNQRLIVLKTTYDESIDTYSPAFLLREDELREIFRVGNIQRLEYFGRLMEWHTKWTENKRTLYHLTVYRWPFLKLLAQARQNRVLSSSRPSP